jgi:hypothetical protein
MVPSMAPSFVKEDWGGFLNSSQPSFIKGRIKKKLNPS